METNDTTLFFPSPLTRENVLCFKDDAPQTIIYHETKASYTDGMESNIRTTPPGQNSGLLLILLATFLFVAFNFKHCYRLFKTSTQDLWSMRQRENAFDDHTSNETRTLLSLLIQLWVYEGILFFAKINSLSTIDENSILPIISSLIGLSAIFYISQLVIYYTLGNVFSDKMGTALLLKGFNASQSILGVTLIIPAYISIFYTQMSTTMFNIAIILYFIARVIFICKGLRIFYHNFTSLLYFILYLCTLEIIPLILIYSGTEILVDFFNQ